MIRRIQEVSAERVQAELERVESGVRRRSGQVTGRLRLATFSTATRGLVAPVLRDLRVTHPGLEVALHEYEPWDTVDLVATGRAPRVDRHGGEVYVYRRAGLPCHVCGTPVARADFYGRNLYWCPGCQPAGASGRAR